MWNLWSSTANRSNVGMGQNLQFVPPYIYRAWPSLVGRARLVSWCQLPTAIPRSSVRHFYRVRRRTSNSGVFLDLVRRFFQVTWNVDSQGFAFFVACISLKVMICLQSVLVCLFRCFLIPPVSAWFTLDQSDPFRWSSKWNRMKLVQCDARVERPKWVYLSWKNIGKDVLPLFQDVGALGYN